MSILDSAAALVRARGQIGRPDGLGRCLENVYNWYGAVPSIGPGRGHYTIALAGWDFSASKLYPMEIAPAGVPVWFGVSPTRTDKNKAAGDVGLSIGGGYGIFTDSPTGNTGIMSFVDRGLQIRRPPLGFSTDFLGHDTTAGLAWLRNTDGKPVLITPPKTVQTSQEKNPMSDVKIIPVSDSKELLLHNAVTGGFESIDTPDDARDLATLLNGTGRLPKARVKDLDAKYFRPAGPIAFANIIASATKNGQIK